MKKSLFTLAAALALVGCSKEELVNVDDGQLQNGNAIAFSTYVGDNAQTRASVIEIDDLQLNGFGVNAYYTGTTPFSPDATYEGNAIFMKNTKVTYNPEKDVWTYSPVKYWPNNDGDMLSFFAYAPYTSNLITFPNDANKAKLNFTVDGDVKNQVDLIYHPANGNEEKGCEKTIDLEKQSVNSTVNFNFQHALSRITFDVKAVVDEATEGDNLLDGNTRINIKKVALVNTDTDYEATGVEGAFYQSGVLDLTDGSWTDASGDQGFEFDGSKFYRAVEDNGETVAQLTKFNPAQTLLKEDSYLMIIPQDFNAETGDTPDGYRIYIEYDVISEEVDNNGSSDNTTNDGNTITNKIYSNAMHTTFEAGKAYKFTLLLGMTSVKFNADVADWDDAEDYDSEEWLPENIPFVADEDGTFLIQSVEDLVSFRTLINNGSTYIDENGEEKAYADANYLQTKDIDLLSALEYVHYSNYYGNENNLSWLPIGTGEGDTEIATMFSGTYDGGNHTVSNVNHTDSHMSGLFYKTKNATIKNLKVQGTISYNWAGHIGGIVGYAYGEDSVIENCHFTGSITVSDGLGNRYDEYGEEEEIEYPYYVGGIAGNSDGKIIACSNGAKISGSRYIGGIVGNGTAVQGCYNYGEVSVIENADLWNIGGIAGFATEVVGCYNYMFIKQVEDEYASHGQIAGYCDNITYSYYTNEDSGISGYHINNSTPWNVADWQTASGYLNYGLSYNGIEWSYEDSESDSYPLVLTEGSVEGNDPYPITTFDLEATNLKHDEDNNIYITSADDLVEARKYINDGYQMCLDTDDNVVYYLKYDASVNEEDVVKSPDYDYFYNGHYIQTADIELPTDSSWEPIGTATIPFKGSYSGANDYESNHTISNLTISMAETDAYVGLFGYCSGDATISNITMKDVSIGSEDTYISGYAGAIVGMSGYEMYIESCIVESGSIYAEFAGGIAYGGENTNVINCTNKASIYANSKGAGIIVNANNGSIRDCTNEANVTSNGSYASGIVDEARFELINCHNKGDIKGGSAAGIVSGGFNEVKGCSNTGSVTATSIDAGGIAASNNSGVETTVKGCWNEGDVKSAQFAGGIVATADNQIDIIGCYNIGSVASNSDNLAGGIIGKISLVNSAEYNEYTAQNFTGCYTNVNVPLIGTVGKVPSDTPSDEGTETTIYEYRTTFNGCYYVAENAIGSYPEGFDASTAIKVETNTYAGWTEGESSPMNGLNTALMDAGISYIKGENDNHPLKLDSSNY